jgi:hypothetical protein
MIASLGIQSRTPMFEVRTSDDRIDVVGKAYPENDVIFQGMN